MLAVSDFDRGTGHRLECVAVRRSLACSCAHQLYELAASLEAQLEECDQVVQEHDAEG